jgi:hypothetical protein
MSKVQMESRHQRITLRITVLITLKKGGGWSFQVNLLKIIKLEVNLQTGSIGLSKIFWSRINTPLILTWFLLKRNKGIMLHKPLKMFSIGKKEVTNYS